MDSLNRLIATDSELIKHIALEQRTLRLMKFIPTWEVFEQGQVWWERKRHLDPVQMRKYRAWWNMLFTVMRNEKDNGSLYCAVAYLVKETARRGYSKELNVNPEKWKIPPDHARKIQEHVLTNFEDLNPDAIKKVDGQ